MPPRCKGKCDSLGVNVCSRDKPYDSGHRRCMICGRYYHTKRIRCPCCSAILRAKPSTSRSKRPDLKLVARY